MQTPKYLHLLCLAVQPEGKLLAIGAEDGRLIFWDLEAAEAVRVVRRPDGVCRVAWTPDGAHLLAGERKGEVLVFPAGGEEPARTLAPGHGTLWGLAVHPDGTRLGTCGSDGMLRIWSLPDLGLLWENGYDGVGCDSIGFAGELVVVGRTSGRFEVFRGPGEEGGVLGGRVRPSGLVALAVRPQGDVVVLGAEKGGMVAVSTDLDEMWPTLRKWSIPPRQICVNALAWSPDGSRFAAACSDGAVRLIRWGEEPDHLGRDLGKPFWLRRPKPPWNEAFIHSWVGFSPDGQTLYSCCFDGTASSWDLAAERPQSSRLFSVSEDDVTSS